MSNQRITAERLDEIKARQLNWLENENLAGGEGEDIITADIPDLIREIETLWRERDKQKETRDA